MSGSLCSRRLFAVANVSGFALEASRRLCFARGGGGGLEWGGGEMCVDAVDGLL